MEFNYKSEYIHIPKCYETCNSYCCIGKNLNFLKHNFMMLPLLEQEFTEYTKSGAIKGLEKPKHIEKFQLKDGAIVRIYWLQCDLNGLCSPHENRPLICKLYPFLPKVDANGRLKGYMPASISEIIFDKSNHPCTLVKNSTNEICNQLNQNILPLLKQPIYIFAFMVYELLLTYFKNWLNKKFETHLISQMPKENIKKYYKEIEIDLLLRRAWKNQECINSINDAYNEIVKIWGNFLPFK